MKILLDNETDLTAICQQADWHHATAVDLLTETGVNRREAESFIDYAFEVKACRRAPVASALLGPLAVRVSIPSETDTDNISVRLDKTTVKALRKLGKGNLSAGVRIAARRANGCGQ